MSRARTAIKHQTNEEITITCPRQIHMLDKLQRVADHDGTTLETAVLRLIDIGLREYGETLYDLPSRIYNGKVDKTQEFALAAKTVLLYGDEYARLMALCEEWDCDNPSQFYDAVLKSLAGGKQLRAEYRRLLSEGALKRCRTRRHVELQFSKNMVTRLHYLRQFAGDDDAEFLRLILYMDLTKLCAQQKEE